MHIRITNVTIKPVFTGARTCFVYTAILKFRMHQPVVEITRHGKFRVPQKNSDSFGLSSACADTLYVQSQTRSVSTGENKKTHPPLEWFLLIQLSLHVICDLCACFWGFFFHNIWDCCVFMFSPIPMFLSNVRILLSSFLRVFNLFSFFLAVVIGFKTLNRFMYCDIYLSYQVSMCLHFTGDSITKISFK